MGDPAGAPGRGGRGAAQEKGLSVLIFSFHTDADAERQAWNSCGCFDSCICAVGIQGIPQKTAAGVSDSCFGSSDWI